jgi:hypothetical protein
VQVLLQADPRQLHDGPFLGLFTGHPPNLDHPDLDVLQGAQVIKEVEVLEDHPHLLAVGVEVPLLGVVDLPVLEPDPALVGLDQEVDALKQGALAGAGGADEDLEVPSVHVERGPLEDVLLPVALRDVFDPENGRFHRCLGSL